VIRKAMMMRMIPRFGPGAMPGALGETRARPLDTIVERSCESYRLSTGREVDVDLFS